MKKLYHPIPYKKPISTTLMSVHTTQRNRQYSINYRCQKPNAIPAFKRFNRYDHDINNHGKIIIIEQLKNIRRYQLRH